MNLARSRRNYGWKLKVGTYVGVILSETFSLSESGVTRVETSRAEGGHNFEITVSTKRGSRATVM